MRIALVTEVFYPKVDGIVRTVERTANHLTQAGHQVVLLAPAGAPRQLGATPVIGFPAVGMSFYPELRIPIPSWRAFSVLRHFGADVVHLFSPVSLGLSALWAAKRLHRPVVASYHTDLPGFAAQYGWGWLVNPARTALRLAHNQAHLTLAPSTYTLRQLHAWGIRRLRLWGRGVDTLRFHPDQRTVAGRHRLLGQQPDTGQVLVLAVGRLAHEKRLDWLRPLADLPGVALAIVGDGPLRQELEARFQGSNTIFCGFLEGEDLAQAYASADLFVHAGAHETFGQVLVEAMASGLPVIAPAAGGPLDLVTSGETGLLYPADDQAALTEAVRTLAAQPEQRQCMGNLGRERMLAQTWTATMARLEGYYAEALRLEARRVSLRRMGIGLAPLR